MIWNKKTILSSLALLLLIVTLAISYIYSNARTQDASETMSLRSVCAFEDEVNAIADPQVLTNTGDLFFNGERGYDRICARLAYERAISKDPDATYYARYQLGRINFIEGQFDVAIEQLNIVREHSERALPSVHYMLGLTYAYRAQTYNNTDDWILAEESFKSFLLRKPTNPWAATDLAWVYFAQGKHEAMLPVLERSLSFTPLQPWVNNMYGLALMNTGESAKAIPYFEIAEQESMKVTVEEWGNAYPGNNPLSYEKGLEEMRTIIRHNLALAKENSAQ